MLQVNVTQKINIDIIDIYKKWQKEIKNSYPNLLSEDYSNVFCTGILENWITSDMRILIVGEEATWKSRKDYEYNDENELQQCQQWILNDLNQQLYDNTVKNHSSPFWQRIQIIHAAFPKAAICWTNIDVINNAKTHRALSENDRQKLHSCKTRVLREVVELTKPTHILFFGWHNTSLKHEFPELISEVYPNKYGDTGYMKENGYILKTNYNDIHIVFTYHPQSRQASSKEYTNRVIEITNERI